MTNATTTHPITQFQTWLDEAKKDARMEMPNAMCLATATSDGIPSSRMVLLKDADERGLVFYTNFGSKKAQDLTQNPRASACFYWDTLGKQVRVNGTIERVSDEEADAYFASRARRSRIGAWASKQSQPLTSMKHLYGRVAKTTARYPVGDIPRPDFWGGYRIVPLTFEFWQLGDFRIHERQKFYLQECGTWTSELLYP